jgi:hypothetical protein
MMHDDMNGPEGRSERNGQPSKRDERSKVMSDREVPLNRHRTPALVHAWLDGDVAEAEVRQGEMVRDVEFWNRISEQSEARRQMRTPVHLQARIMEALPQTAQVTSAEPWYQRSLEVSPLVAAAVGATMLAIGAAAAILLGS